MKPKTKNENVSMEDRIKDMFHEIDQERFYQTHALCVIN